MTPSGQTQALYKHVYEEVMNLQVARQMFDGLYGPNGDVALLNRIASQTFGFIQRLFYDALLLQSAKVYDTDAKATSLPNLITAVRADGLRDLANNLNSKMPDAAIRESVRLHRNKRVAHIDLDVKSGAATLPSLKLADITACTLGAHAVINAYAVAVERTEIGVGVILDTKGGTHVLLDRLLEAEAYRQEHPDYWMNDQMREYLRKVGHDPAAHARSLEKEPTK